MDEQTIRAVFDLQGVVQGIGMRPALHRLARAARLGGFVQNRSGTVRLSLEGTPDGVDDFVTSLPDHLPPHARLDDVIAVSREPIPPGETVAPFRIIDSTEGDGFEILIPADLAMCPDCKHEILDAEDRRFGYPFTTCTRCGPRYTVLESMPYDRERTTMKCFPLCPDCRAEYENPDDRRFHAESIACSRCGPSLALLHPDGSPLPGHPLQAARRLLSEGGILAVRGLGGFHLAADAMNRDAISLLRARKDRPHKPFAVMAQTLDTIRELCDMPPAAEGLLQSVEAPIAILDTRETAIAAGLPIDLLTPDAMTLGIMLPTTPLHHLLLAPLDGDPTPSFRLLVMTSANARGEPICISTPEALDRLDNIADAVLTHDREINLRCDDSVTIIQSGRPQVWRRARGYAPHPVALRFPLAKCALAMGAENKNCIAVAWEDRIVPSPHIGDLDTPAALDGFDRVVATLPAFLGRRPEVVAVDLHPDMYSSVRGRQEATAHGIPVCEVQHHHAHAMACLAEHGIREGLALTFDGTGLGPDGAIWGAELLECLPKGYRRLATFLPVALPGADEAVRTPVRQLVARWHDASTATSPAWRDRLGITEEQDAVWRAQCDEALNSPRTHAAGRLFDTFSMLLGFPPAHITYEGQAAIRLEAAARRYAGGSVPPISFNDVERDGMLYIDWRGLFASFPEPGSISGREAELAMALHRAVAEAALRMVEYGLSVTSYRSVALSGGVFMNRILTEILVPRLQARGLDVLLHRATPPNDGCIAIGQAAIAGAEGDISF